MTLAPLNAGAEHVGFPPTRQALLAPSAKRRVMFERGRGGRTKLLLAINICIIDQGLLSGLSSVPARNRNLMIPTIFGGGSAI